MQIYNYGEYLCPLMKVLQKYFLTLSFSRFGNDFLKPDSEYIAPFMANFVRRGGATVEYKELQMPKNKRIFIVRWN